MLGQSIWWSGLALEACVLSRGLRGRLVFRYPVFYSYICFVLLQSILRFSAYLGRHELYRDVFWITEVLGILIGCAIVFEIYRIALHDYPGTARMARVVLAFVFVSALAKALTAVAKDPGWWQGASLLEI